MDRGVLELANRETGNWLPNVKICPKRAKPCGNPFCADEAMHSAQILSAGTSYLSRLQAEQARGHAIQIAQECIHNLTACPLENICNIPIIQILKILSSPTRKVIS